MRRLRDIAARPLGIGELKHVNDWAVREGWNPGLYDSRVFQEADPGSFLTVENKGEPAGALSAVCYTADFGFAGFFVTAPECRNSFYGWTLLQAGLQRFGVRSIGAEAVPERLGLYAHYGMTPHSKTISFAGLCPLVKKTWAPCLRSAKELSFNEIADYDARAFGAPRFEILKSWLGQPATHAIGYVSGNRLLGFGVVRRAFRGVRIGPLQADSPEIAGELIDALEGFAPGEELTIDCPDTNQAGLRLMKEKAFFPIDSTIRIYRGVPPKDIPFKVFGRMSFALG